ncbi:redoxin domain-containing protein [soil metagenome]
MIGEPVASFTLPDVSTGEPFTLDHCREARARVLIFTGIDCPVGDLYMPRLVEIVDRYAPQGVVFLGINSNRLQTAEEAAEQVRTFALNFPILKDEGNVVADALQALRTCEVLVLDAEGILRYRGAIDDQYGLGIAREEPRMHYLTDAIEAVLEGEEPRYAATSVVGCPIERVNERDVKSGSLPIAERVTALVSAADLVRPPSAELTAAWAEFAPEEDALIDEVGPVTYSMDVAPILLNKCQNCHRPGQVGPFTLMNYEEVARRANGIQEVVDLRRMPPWHADPRHGHFDNDRSLTSQERATVLAWIEQGTPEGDPADLPEPIEWSDGWLIGKPDLVVTMPEAYTVKAEGVEGYQYIRVPLNLPEDRWVQAAEARPGDRSVVHHIIAYVVPKGERRADERRGHLCGFAPGEMPTILPPGTAKKIPAGADLVLQMHYTPIGKVRRDQSQVGLVFAKEPPQREGITMPIANSRLEIPPGEAAHEVRSRRVFDRETLLLAFMPHMHLRGKAFTYSLTRAGQQDSEILLHVPAFDFGWQSYYRLAEPIDLKPGDRIDCLAYFDNSPDNPVNPDPEATVRWGDQTWQEMMIGYVDISFPIPQESKTTEVAASIEE